MADIPAVREGYIQEQECEFKAAVSEYTARRMGSNINFMLDYTYEHAFKMNGPITSFNGKLGVDGLFVFPKNAKIIDAIIYLEEIGSSGSLQLDVLTSVFPSGTFTSIYTTKPAISSTAAAYSTCGVGDVVTGCTAPVLISSTIPVAAKTRLRMDVTGMQGGFPKNGGILIKYIEV